MWLDIDKPHSSALLVAFVVGSSFKLVTQLPKVHIWLCNDIQGKCISDRVDAKSQCLLLPIFRDDLCGLSIHVVVLYELDDIIHV